MIVSLTIIKYRRRFIPIAFLAMVFHRFSFWFQQEVPFFKLMGTGKNGTFDKQPDLQQWAIMSTHKNLHENSFAKCDTEMLYGKFISRWFRLFNCKTIIHILEPIECHGTWDGKKPFGNLPAKSDYDGRIAVLTRATIRLNKLKYFWKNVAPVAAIMVKAKGFEKSYGVGEIPWIKQATFSIWESKKDMQNFAYGMKEHADVIKKTRKEKWYSEDMFTRFRVLGVWNEGLGIGN